MAVLKIFLAILGVLLLSGCAKREDYSSGMDHATANRSRVLFAYNDSQFDDRGAGRYIYPIPLQTQEGIFDLRKFQVRDLGKTYEFMIEFLRPMHQESLDETYYGKNWKHQMIDIYVDNDHIHNSGFTFSLPGRNVEFNSQEGWEKAVVITPGPTRDIQNYLTEHSEYRKLYKARKDVYVANDVSVINYGLIVRVPKTELGDISEASGFQVLVMGYDPENDTRNGMYNSWVQTFATNNRFGGGSDYQGNPNVIDILSPDKKSQYHVLSQYRSKPYEKDNLFSIIPMIYGKGKQKLPENRQIGMNRAVQSSNHSVDARYTAPPEVSR